MRVSMDDRVYAVSWIEGGECRQATVLMTPERAAFLRASVVDADQAGLEIEEVAISFPVEFFDFWHSTSWISATSPRRRGPGAGGRRPGRLPDQATH